MRHELDNQPLGARADAMKHAVETCVHCGFCLPTCPTYDVLGLEADSPRGRIVLMKNVLEGSLDVASAAPHIDRCLGCVACETYCPSGVPYGELLASYRAETQTRTPRTLAARMQAWIACKTLPYPLLLRPAMKLGRLAKRLGKLNPKPLRPMVELVPEELPQSPELPQENPATEPRVGAVAIHLGCVQRVLRPEISAATVRVLQRNGYDVTVLGSPSCCGALDWHVGHEQAAVKFAKKLVNQVPEQMPLVTTAAGCGSTIREYPLVLAGADEKLRARGSQLAAQSLDVSELLAQNGLRDVPETQPIRVAYHDACHLLHAQRVKSAPRQLLAQIPGVTLLEVPDGHFCCGSAGLYNVQQPELAEELGRRKAVAIQSLEPDVVVLGNIGCQVQIERYLKELKAPVPVLHTIEFIDRVYRGVDILSDDASLPEPVVAAS